MFNRPPTHEIPDSPVSTVDRFAKADADGNARLTPREFSTTAP